MARTKGNPIRCLQVVAIAATLVLAASVASAQGISVGMTGSKTCPAGVFNPGDPITCNFTFNNDSTNAVTFDALSNTFPCVNNHIDPLTQRVVCDAGSGTPDTAIQCLQGGVAVTSLGAEGTATQECSGTLTEVVPGLCGAGMVTAVDRVSLDFHDSTMPGLTGFNDATSSVIVNFPACGVTGRMTGGGSVFAGPQRVTHGFELHCDPEIGPNNLEVNWSGNHFHMEELLTAECTDDPNIDQRPPKSAPFDTYHGTGVGRCNGVSGAMITFTFVDAGEPGKKDTANIVITGCPDPPAGISVSGFLKKGNHQTHLSTGSKQ